MQFTYLIGDVDGAEPREVHTTIGSLVAGLDRLGKTVNQIEQQLQDDPARWLLDHTVIAWQSDRPDLDYDAWARTIADLAPIATDQLGPTKRETPAESPSS